MATIHLVQVCKFIHSVFLFSACNCDSVGGVSGGECEGKNDPEASLVAGRCICKTNVEGQRCDRCKPGFWNLRRDDPDGCKGTCKSILLSVLSLSTVTPSAHASPLFIS